MMGKDACAWLLGALPLSLLITMPTLAQTDTEDLPRLEDADCPTEALRELGATCHTFHAPENWREPNGSSVVMPVAVIEPETDAVQADAEDPEADDTLPVYFFPGGPGYSSLYNREYLEQLLKDVGDRTLVTMDHRGFIHAEPALECPDYAAVSPYHNIIHTPAITASLEPMHRLGIITSAVEACYNKLNEEGHDLSQYNSHAISRDVDELRQLLGHERIDGFGSSTGSGTLASFIQYHPESIRAAIFGWPWFNHLRNRPPVDELYTAKQTFTDTLALCAAEDEACREMLPNGMQAFDRARRMLDARPYVTHVATPYGHTETLYFDGAAFVDTLYLMLASDYAELPSLVADVEVGDYSRLETFFRIDDYDPEPEAPNYALGYFLAHVCNDMGTNRPSRDDSIAAVEREPAVLGFEPPWLCAWWGEDGDVPAEHNDPPVSETPALAIHGEMDPCCGTRWSHHLQRTMPNLQYVEYQALGHSPVNACRSEMIQAFLDDPMAAVDASCRDEVEREPWVIEPPRGSRDAPEW
ncbi:alpha/beta fold hydrolase [Billgrantia sp. LNSP4103-1]|uniref:alpha/beta fold hydrolase n=1 Tax=Billgrantia sp. LNSP4103-1 TaxID=3410266 RepID=UPI00403F884A